MGVTGPAGSVELTLRDRNYSRVECVSQGNLPGASGEEARVGPDLLSCAVRAGEGPGLGLMLPVTRPGFCCLWMWSQPTGGGLESVSRLWQPVLLGVRKECLITRENSENHSLSH